MYVDLFLLPVCVKVENLGIGRSNRKLISLIVVISKRAKILIMCWFCEIVTVFF